MTETTLTVRQIMDLGLWEKVCEYKGWNEWILNEGRISEDEEVTFNSTFEKEEVVELTGAEKVKELYDEYKRMTGWTGHDGSEARTVCDTIEKVLGVLEIEIEGINS